MQRYANPLAALAEAFQIKAPLSAVAAAAASLFQQDIQLPMLVALLVVLDFVLGLSTAWKLGEPITSRKMRDSIPKIIEYACILVGVTAFANTFLGSAASWVSATAYCYVCSTEVKSLFEHCKSNPAVVALWDGIKDRFQPPSDHPPLAGA